jgi:hypothetical protein
MARRPRGRVHGSLGGRHHAHAAARHMAQRVHAEHTECQHQDQQQPGPAAAHPPAASGRASIPGPVSCPGPKSGWITAGAQCAFHAVAGQQPEPVQ